MSPWYIDPLHITLRLLLSLLLGGLIGFEREQNSHAAGFRTHIMVCLGATLVMLLSMYGFSEFAALDNVRLDPARLAAQVISGIGFLGAGTIIYTGKSISGLTTAASLWVVAAIGLSIGAGFYYAGVLTSMLALISLWMLNVVEQKYLRGKKTYTMIVHAYDRPRTLSAAAALFSRHGAEIRKMNVEHLHPETESMVSLAFYFRLPNRSAVLPLLEELNRIEGVTGVTFE